jgi:hypothetical protein
MSEPRRRRFPRAPAEFTILADPNFLHAGDHVHLSHGDTYELEVSGV